METVHKRPQAAAYLGMSTAALAQLQHRGKGPKMVKFGHRSVRYRESDLDAWLESNVEESTRSEARPAPEPAA